MKKKIIVYTSEEVEALEKSLYCLCTDFLTYVEYLMKSNKILIEEYETYTKLKRDFIQQKKTNSY